MTDKIIVSGFDADTGVAKNVELLSRDGGALVEVAVGRESYQWIREYSGNPGATTRVLTWPYGVERVTVEVEAAEAETDATPTQRAAVRVAWNMSAAMGDVALVDRDAGQYGDQFFDVIKLGKPKTFEFKADHQRVYQVAFRTDAGTLTKVRFIGERDERTK